MSMQRVLAGLLVLAALVSGCGGKPAAEEKRLTLYTSFGADLYNPLAQAFEQKTGIKVDVVFGGTGEILTRVDAEKANPLADVVLGGGAESYVAYLHLWQPYKVKDDALIPDQLKAADRAWYGFNSLPIVLAYNTKMVTAAAAPKGWADLTDPKWKGKIVMADATKSGTSYAQVTAMLSIFGKDDGKGWDVVKKVVANSKVLGSSSLVVKGLNDGEYAVALTYEQGAFKYKQAGGPVEIVYPKEGTVSFPDAVAMAKGARHPNNAKLFMDWLFSKETQEMAARQLLLRPARTDVAPPEGLVPAQEIKLIGFDMTWAGTRRSEILNIWKDIVTAK